MIPRVNATVFHRFMDSGRTSPAIFSCEDEAVGEMRDYVVKLRGGMERREGALLCELYASLLAGNLGIGSPNPAIVLIGPDFAELVASNTQDPSRAQVIRNSIGLNFGTNLLSNLSVWAVDKHVPAEMLTAAVEVFAFDALIQNPDRTFNNPNLGTRGNELLVFDHESAFSFLLAIFPALEPWKLDTERYLDNHVFARSLKGEQLSEDFMGGLAALSDAVFKEFSAQIPAEWRRDDLNKIETHLRLVREHAAEFAEGIQRRLA